MAIKEKTKPYSLIILVMSIIGLILMLSTDFAGFYLTGYYSGSRYSCLWCEYNTTLDRIAIICIILLLIVQILVVLNDILPKKVLSENVAKLGVYLAVLTLLFTIIGGVAFAIEYGDYDWWFETGFYAGAIAGLINIVLFFLKAKSK